MVSMFNSRRTETPTDFPFARLNALITSITPPAHLSIVNLAVGEPQGAMLADRYIRVALVHDEKTHPRGDDPPRRGAVMMCRISCPGFMSLPRHTGEGDVALSRAR